MKISTRMRYGMRAVCELAAQHPSHLSLHQIAEREGLSVKYLEQIMSRLRGAGLVKASTGMNGGYVLTREPKRIKVSEAYRALEGSPALVFCIEANAECPRMRHCPTRCLWRSVTDAMVGVMDKTTVADLVRREGRVCVEPPKRKPAKSPATSPAKRPAKGSAKQPAARA